MWDENTTTQIYSILYVKAATTKKKSMCVCLGSEDKLSIFPSWEKVLFLKHIVTHQEVKLKNKITEVVESILDTAKLVS